MRTLFLTLFAASLGSCSASCSALNPPPPPSDGGTTQDVAPKEAAACVPDFTTCTAQSICCTSTFACNPGTGECQQACLPIGSICNGGDCCSGICNGTCE